MLAGLDESNCIDVLNHEVLRKYPDFEAETGTEPCEPSLKSVEPGFPRVSPGFLKATDGWW